MGKSELLIWKRRQMYKHKKIIKVGGASDVLFYITV